MVFTHYLKPGDTSPAIQRVLTDEDGTAINLSGATVTFRMRRRENAFIGETFGRQNGTPYLSQPATVVQTTDDAGGWTDVGVVRYDWSPGDTDTRGVFLAEFHVRYADGTTETFPNRYNEFIRIVIGDSLAAEPA